MGRKYDENRRNFLKKSAAGTAGLAILSTGVGKSVKAATNGVWTDDMQINPEIDNLRVVYTHDPSMVTNQGWSATFTTVNTRVNTAKVAENLDKMAIALAQKTSASDAWAKIFRKPDGKTWSQVKVAIKVNGLGNMHCKVAILAKLCDALHNLNSGSGVDYGKIVIYDAKSGATQYYNSYVGTELHKDVIIRNKLGEYTVDVNGTNMKCTTDVQDADILITCANCKSHDSSYGKVTMCCKNHIGTMKFNCPSGTVQLCDMQKSSAILGNPGETVPVKQQLALVDCLWGSRSGGYAGNADMFLGYLVMGTFAPSVDYLCARKVREAVMSTAPDSSINKFITEFGYTDTERTNLTDLSAEANGGKGWVDANSWAPVSASRAVRERNGGSIIIIAGGNGFRRVTAQLAIPHGSQAATLSIYNIGGRLIQNLSLHQSEQRIVWEGTDRLGAIVPAGTYFVRITGQTGTSTARLHMVR